VSGSAVAKYDSLWQRVEARYFSVDQGPKRTRTREPVVIRRDCDEDGNVPRESGEEGKGK